MARSVDIRAADGGHYSSAGAGEQVHSKLRNEQSHFGRKVVMLIHSGSDHTDSFCGKDRHQCPRTPVSDAKRGGYLAVQLSLGTAIPRSLASA